MKEVSGYVLQVTGDNVDDVRARIMALESAVVFDQRAWGQVLIALSDRPNARADAARRMETAKGNQERGAYAVPCEKITRDFNLYDLPNGKAILRKEDDTAILVLRVAAETAG